jgi:hypothetical protein
MLKPLTAHDLIQKITVENQEILSDSKDLRRERLAQNLGDSWPMAGQDGSKPTATRAGGEFADFYLPSEPR